MASSSRTIMVASLLLMALVMVAAGEHARVHKFWETKLPGVAMPVSLRDAVSPIEGSAMADLFAMHIEHGTFYPATSASFCKMAGLVCHDEPSVDRNGFDKGAFNYKAASSAGDHHHHHHQGAVMKQHKGYFLATNLVEGATMRLREQARRESRSFLPSIVADALPPLSTLTDSESSLIMKLESLFDLRKGSEMFAAVEFALEVCRDGKLPGEDRVCPTSLESLVNFVSSHLEVGSQMKILTSSPRPRTVMGPMKVRRFTEYYGQTVVCHVLDFPSQLYMCHFVPDTKVFEASLTDATGAVTRAVGCCHLDTKTWNPEHQSFKSLGVKPGTPICHWSGEDTLVWVSKSTSNLHSSDDILGHDHTAM